MPYDRYDGIVESAEVGDRMADALGDGQVLVLKNHGIVAVGRDVAEAVCAAVIFEENAAIQLLAMTASNRISGLPDDEAEAARDFLASSRVVGIRWRQLARKARKRRDFLPEVA